MSNINPDLRKYIEEESFFKAVVEDGSDIIFIVDYNGIILYHNPAVKFILGYDPGTLVGKNFFDYIDPNKLNEFKKKFKVCTSLPYSKNIEFQFLTTENNYQYLEFNSINLVHKENIEGLILDCRDITQLKEDAEELRRAKQAKEQFLANMSHEIRTPINGIAGMVNLLNESDPNDEQINYLNAIKNSADNLKVIINDILDFSAIESGKLRFEKIGFMLNQQIPNVINNFNPTANEKGLNLIYDIGEELDIVLIGDPVRLNQVLNNLISNAVKFTLKGQIKVNASIKKIEKDIANVRLVVSDTGIGIPDEKLEHIFETFSQADDSVTRRFGGTGLGLSIVKQLVELQKGKIKVKSDINQGTTFTIDIPYEIGTSKDLVQEVITTSKHDTKGVLEGMRILLVEDNDINRLYAMNIMKNWGCVIDQAENGLICLEKLKRNDYDAILMDIQMPVMDGIEATVTIRETLSPPKSTLPILALTANAMKGENETYLKSGMNDYLSKPFTSDELLSILRKYYGKPELTASETKPKKDPEQDSKPDAVSDSSLVDLTYLKKMSNNDEDFIREMIHTFIQTTPDNLSSMDNHLESENLHELGRVAHKLKPSVDLMGIKSLQGDIRKIEEMSKNGELSNHLKGMTINFIKQTQNAIEELKLIAKNEY